MGAWVLVNSPEVTGQVDFQKEREKIIYYHEGLMNKHAIRKGSEEILGMALIDV